MLLLNSEVTDASMIDAMAIDGKLLLLPLSFRKLISSNSSEPSRRSWDECRRLDNESVSSMSSCPSGLLSLIVKILTMFSDSCAAFSTTSSLTDDEDSVDCWCMAAD